jgi:gamma-D-glutamyl-L-lysine dipeptidyl-peptidase
MSEKAIGFGICLQTYVPVRKDPYERAEMVTQTLFGDAIEILDEEGNWLYIKILLDSYEGWIDKKCINQINKPPDSQYIVFKNNLSVRNITTGHTATVAIGGALPAIKEKRFKLGSYEFELDDPAKILIPGSPDNLMRAVHEVVSLPYLWGGRSGFGFDCSGLVQYLCRVSGTHISRDASEQSAEGETLSFINEVKSGDLAFFDDTEGMIHHVGMMLGDGKIIHASGTVRIDRIDQQGIYNETIRGYSHKLRVMKRVIK